MNVSVESFQKFSEPMFFLKPMVEYFQMQSDIGVQKLSTRKYTELHWTYINVLFFPKKISEKNDFWIAGVNGNPNADFKILMQRFPNDF